MRSRPKLLLLESGDFSPAALRVLRELADVIRTDKAGGDLRQLLPFCDMLWVRLRHRVDTQMLRQAHNLKVIISGTTGLNHIDLDEALSRGIQVLSLRGEADFLRDVRATAEHTLALMLALIRHLPAAVQHVKTGAWNRDHFKGTELYGKTVGIVGYGRLGRIVARYLNAFEVNVLVCDPELGLIPPLSDVTPVTLQELLKQSDLVTLHLSLNEQTVRCFGRPEFASMKPGAFFINTARGELVDESALLHALETEMLKGAALDVICNEHSGPIDSPLIRYMQTHDNLIITPHVGGCTHESMEKTETYLARKLSELWSSREAAPHRDAAGAPAGASNIR
jgi:D-3-phosphoglycerate dehydrogenase